MIKIKKFSNKESLFKELVNYYVKRINENPNIKLGLATGSSPIPLYKGLIEEYENKKVSFKNVLTFNLDEYVGLEKENDQSYYYFMFNNLFNHVDINKNNVNIPSGNVSDLNKECDRYNKLLSNNKIDIQLLGIGANGHIGFNEPGTEFETRTHIVDLDSQTIKDNSRFFESIDLVPKKAITMGISDIVNADKVILIATGKNKAEAIKKLAESDKFDINFPASSLYDHKNFTVYADEDACSLIKI